MKLQRGGFAIGLIVGLLLGLILALGVALYVTKVPVPFVNKVPQRTAEQDAAEVEKNKNWDPNAPLYGKNPAKAASSPASAVVTAPAPVASAPAAVARAPSGRASGAAGSASPAASTKPGSEPFTYFVQAGAYGRNEEAEQQRARLAMIGFEGKLTEREQSGRTVYRVRVGPFDKKEDADAAKDKLADAGVEAALVRVAR